MAYYVLNSQSYRKQVIRILCHASVISLIYNILLIDYHIIFLRHQVQECPNYWLFRQEAIDIHIC